MSLPPRAFDPTVGGLARAGLNGGPGWTRLVVEKPFGKDLESARELNSRVHEHFDESQVYRIDHYLGKDTVQNLLVFRFANAFIESNWNRERIEAVQITVAEDLGVGTRAGYYDHSGALRDMVQNHLTQLLTLVAMEVPTSFSAEAIRNEKIKVLKSIQPLDIDNVVRGRYTRGEVRGETIPGYLESEGVADDSTTETFVALKMFVDSWRWQGVPFFLRTGKCLPRKTTQITVRFRRAPVSFFNRMGCDADTSDVLTITLQPNEGFTFYLDIKKPSSSLEIERIPLRFRYDTHFEQTMPDAYRTLLLDVLKGDQTLFVHADEVEESWRVYKPLIETPPSHATTSLARGDRRKPTGWRSAKRFSCRENPFRHGVAGHSDVCAGHAGKRGGEPVRSAHQRRDRRARSLPLRPVWRPDPEGGLRAHGDAADRVERRSAVLERRPLCPAAA